MAKKGDTGVPFQTQTRGAAERRAIENTNPNATAASSILSTTHPVTSSIPAKLDIPESRRRSKSPVETTTPLRNREPAPHPPRLHQAASIRPPTSQHQVVRGAIGASTPNMNGEAIHAKSKKQNTKEKEVTANRHATERHRIIVDDELEVINQDDIQSLLDVENAATEAQAAAAGQETKIQPELTSDVGQWSEDLDWCNLNFGDAVNDEFTWGNHIWTEGDTSIEDSLNTSLDPQIPPSLHPAWTGRGLLAATIASSGGLEQYPVYPVSEETQPETLGLFMSAQDREEMADAELPPPGLTTFSVNSAADSIDTEAFVEGLSREILDTNLDPDLRSYMLGHDYT